MTIDRRIKRDLWRNRSFYFSAALLTAMAAFFVVVMYISVDMIIKDSAELYKSGNVEDAQFVTAASLDDDINDLEKKYSLSLEKVRYFDSIERDYTLRVFAPTQKINRYQMLAGNDLAGKADVLLNRDFAVANGIQPGDNINIAGKSFTVAGFAVRPDYFYAQKESNDMYLDDAVFGQATLTENAFSDFEGTRSYYVVTYEDANREIEFRSYLQDNYYCLKYLSAHNNNRISMASDMIKEYSIVIDVITPLLFALISGIVAVVLARVIKKDKKIIGTLMSMGYRKREIVSHYAVYALIPAIAGSITGILAALAALKPACLLFATDFETINYTARINLKGLLSTLLFPAIFYVIVTVVVVLHMIHAPAVTLLSAGPGKNKKRSRLFADSKISFGKKFRLRTLMKNKVRTLVVLLGLAIGSFICMFGFIMVDSFQYYVDKGMDEAGSYEYMYYFNTVENGTPAQGEAMLSASYEVEGTRTLIDVCGVAENSEYLELNLIGGKKLRYGDFYITTNGATQYGVKDGDNFTLRNALTLEEYTITINGIIHDDTRNTIYTSLDEMAKLAGLATGSYNALMSDKELKVDMSRVYTVYSKEMIKEQFQFAVDIVMSFIYFIIAVGVIICMVITYLIVNMLVDENRRSISMFKVFGYRNREINRLILNANHILVPVSFILSLVFCLAVCREMFKTFISALNIYMEPVITLPAALVCAAILSGSYFVSLLLLRRKVLKVDMVESLKDNRE